ncbi:hypothetical protein HU200_043525 [Digitaria exilis]|uniref:RNase H type-1 domain-containing protein n=1 Tax=Digitaria exilis TaxID=1010633 RepID=A0A835B495_9POAL|nr:hypothetical protein HU200_043525 [Digitaria exilis]
MTRVVVTLWAVWHARRKALHENVFQGPLSTHAFINRFITDLGVSIPERNVGRQSQGPLPSWIPPPQGHTKINVDAAISKNSGFATVVAVARDDTGTFIGASTVVSYGTTDPKTMEAMACREGLALANDLLLRKVRLAGDCTNVIRSCGGAAMGPYGHIIQENKRKRRVSRTSSSSMNDEKQTTTHTTWLGVPFSIQSVGMCGSSIRPRAFVILIL